MFRGLTHDLVEEAVRIVLPTVEHFLQSERTGGRPNLYLVVLEPRSENVLYEIAFGDGKSIWKYEFDQFALAKARQCMRTGMVGRNVLRDAPWLVKPDDTRYVGGVYENGLVVAASGVQDHFDEMISWLVLSTIQGLCRDEVSKIDDDNDPVFFGT
jgi:hypothetical protein